MTTRYVPEIIYALATISLGMHTLSQRKDAEDQRAYYAGRIALLQDTAARLRTGAPVPASDFALLARLAQDDPDALRGRARGAQAPEDGAPIAWKEVLLGRTPSHDAAQWERRDWEQGQWQHNADSLVPHHTARV